MISPIVEAKPQEVFIEEEIAKQLQCKKELKIIPGATHLFAEPVTLEQVARSWRWQSKPIGRMRIYPTLTENAVQGALREPVHEKEAAAA